MTAQELFEILNNLRSSGIDLSSLEVTKEVWVEDLEMRKTFLDLDEVRAAIVSESRFIIK
jgi:hypothetical protein